MSWVENIGELLDAEYLLVLKAYFDESRDTSRGSTLAVAGYFGRTTEWRLLERRWNNILSFYNIKHGLHMKEFAHFKNEFEMFRHNEPLRQEFLDRLTSTLYKPKPRFVAVGCAVDVHEFAKLPAKVREGFRSDPYLFAFILCVRKAIESRFVQHLPMEEKMGFVFDRRDELQSRGKSLFNYVKDKLAIPERRRIGDLAFGSRSESPPLQAADFIAYEVRRDLDRRISGRPERWAIKRITQCGPSDGVMIFDGPALHRLSVEP